jgi:hypothetical protein
MLGKNMADFSKDWNPALKDRALFSNDWKSCFHAPVGTPLAAAEGRREATPLHRPEFLCFVRVQNRLGFPGLGDLVWKS